MDELCRSDFGSSAANEWKLKEVSVMIKVFTGDVYAVQESEYDRDMLLDSFLNGHRAEYILLYSGEKLQKTLSYEDVLFCRNVPERVLALGKDVFGKARELFFLTKAVRSGGIALLQSVVSRENPCVYYITSRIVQIIIISSVNLKRIHTMRD